MSKLQSLCVFLKERLTAAALESFEAVEKTVVEYQEENDRLRRLLQLTPEIQLPRIDSLQFSVSEEEVPPEQQHCEQERSPSLGQEDPEPTHIKEEQEELRQCLKWTKRSASMPLIPSLASESTGTRKLLDSLQFSVSEEEVPPEQQHCEQERSPSLGQEDPEPTHIKEEQEELRISQTEDELQEVFDNKDSILTFNWESILTPPCVKSEGDQDPLLSFNLSQTQSVEKREREPMDITHFDNMTHLKGFNISCDALDHQTKASNHCSSVSYHMEKSFICSFCGKTFKNIGDLSTHMRIHTGEKSFELTHAGEKSFSCNDSGKSFSEKGNLEKSYICGECGKEYKHSWRLKQHQLIHTGERPFSCDDCGKRFMLKRVLKRHELTHTGEKSFCCCECGKRFSLSHHLKRHYMTHTGEKPFSCIDCGKSFRQIGDLTLHKRTHTGRKSCVCGGCGKGFNDSQILKQHVLTHVGEKPFICIDCGKSFRNNGELTTHRRTHTGEKPFICGDCGKRFSYKCNLTIHKRTHTGEKPYICGDCGKRFRANSSLTMHKVTHTGEKSFSCGECGKRFGFSHSLKRHEWTHTG